jgi:phosphatidate phosphatase PAH1
MPEAESADQPLLITFLTHPLFSPGLQWDLPHWYQIHYYVHPMTMTDSIDKLAAQYFQLVELQQLALPPGPVLIQPAVQAALYENAVFPIPPDSYRSRVLKQILSRIEESITDPEEDVCSPTCLNPFLHFASWSFNHFLFYPT